MKANKESLEEIAAPVVSDHHVVLRFLSSIRWLKSLEKAYSLTQRLVHSADPSSRLRLSPPFKKFGAQQSESPTTQIYPPA